MFKKLLTCFGAGLLVMFALAQQQSQNPTSIVALDTMFYGAVQATVPTNAKMSSIAETFPTGRRVITTAMQGAPSLTTDKYTIEFHFSNGKAVVASLGQAPSTAAITIAQGDAFVVNPSTRAILANATLSLSGNNIVVDAPNAELSGATMDYAVVHWLPAATAESTLSGGFSVAKASYIDFDPNQNDFTNDALWYVPQDRLGGGMPSRSPAYRCPPLGTPGVKVQDVDGNGIWDWEYPFVIIDGNGNAITEVPGTDVIVDIVGLDFAPSGASGNDEFALIIKRDIDGDGVIEQHEIVDIIGRCEYANGDNKIYIEKDSDGKWRVHHINIDPATGERKHYIYDPHTGKIKVYDGNGVLIWGPGDPEDCPYIKHLG